MNDSSLPERPALLATAVEQFNRGEYFAQHETLEVLWRAEPGPVRRLYQGILQVGVAFHHLRRGNYHGTMVMLARGLANLRAFEPVTLGVDIARLVSDTERAYAAVAALGATHRWSFDWALAPRVHWIDRRT